MSLHVAALFLDVETTGLDPRFEEVIELAAAAFEINRESGIIRETGEFYSGMREPRVPIAPGASAVNGITFDMVAGKRLDDARILAMLNAADFIVAHNAPFDLGFVSRLYPAASAKPWLCSMRSINWFREGCNRRTLQHLLAHHGIRPDAAHRAGGDVRSALELLKLTGRDGEPFGRQLLLALNQALKKETA